MERIKRNERLSAMLRILSGTPNRIHTLGEFCDLFGAAKSTISEDIEILSDTVVRFELGEIATVAGAAGGVRYRATVARGTAHRELSAIAEKLCTPSRLLPGGFLYTSDVTADPSSAELLGRLLAQRYYHKQPQMVLTMETKGIPIALMTARMLGVPLVIARRDTRAYEGPAVKINYIAGSDRSIETMALSRRSVTAGQKVLIIDDFMKGGGTLQGMVEMMREFQAEVVGVGVMITTAEPQHKRVRGAKSLLILKHVDMDTGKIEIVPAPEYAEKGPDSTPKKAL
ncbi:MAG: pur operon repressor [Clostridia bacterium]|nr:pur operon repressor [Clostridia bacterium]